MKMPFLIKKSIYAKMPMFFDGGETPNTFQPTAAFKSVFEPKTSMMQMPQQSRFEMPKLPDMQIGKKPSWMDSYGDGDTSESSESSYSDELKQWESSNDPSAPLPKKPKEEFDTMGALRDSMYIGNALLRGFSESNARAQQNEYEQNNIANPLANIAFNDGRSDRLEYGYEQFNKGGFYKKMGKKRNC